MFSLTGWSFGQIEVEELELKIDGATVTPEQVKSRGGTSFVLHAGENSIAFESGLGNSAKLTLNGSSSQVVKGTVELHISPMALCIGEMCMMWPKKPVNTAAWKFDELEIEPGLQLSINDKPVTPQNIKDLGGSSFDVRVDNHLVSFKALPVGVALSLNNKAPQTITEPLHLNISKNAVCIGDACLMWPRPPAFSAPLVFPAQTSTPAPAPAPQTDADFLESIKSKLSPEEYNRLSGLVKSKASEAHSQSKPHHDGVPHIDTKEEWENVLRSAGSKPVIVDCSAVWCAPCKKIAPKFNLFAKEHASQGVFVGVDVQVNSYVKQQFLVDALPTFLFLQNGQEAFRYTGSDESVIFPKIGEFLKGSALVAEKVEKKVPWVGGNTHFDYVVIGGGSGGMASAKEAAKHGAKVAMFDYVKPSQRGTRWGLGGTCVNVGCVPKKLMHYGALLGEGIHDAKVFGWDVNSGKHDWVKLVETVQSHVKKLNFFYEKGLQTANTLSLRNGETQVISNGSITYFNALATFSDAKTVSWKDDFGNTGSVTGDNILIAVGGRPFVPDNIPGVKEYSITSDDLFSLTRSPGKTLCVGAGYISLECGGFLGNLGLDVTICVRSIPLRTGGFDRQCVDKIVSLMQVQGIKFFMATDVAKIEKQGDGKLKVHFFNVSTKETFTEIYDTVLYATGRGADTQKLNVQSAGVQTTSRGTIVADDSDRTNVPHIYALGDVAEGRPELTPVAVQAGEYLARRLFAKSTVLMNYQLVPTTVFTPFEYGIVGLSEENAISKYGKDAIESYLSEFSSLEIGAAHRKRLDKGSEEDDFPTNALSKLVCLKKDGKEVVVGFHYVGPNAGEVTQGFALALKLGATKKDFDEVVGIHPTDAESFMALGITKSSGEQWESAGGCGGGKCG
eukprot:TRINITY_DN2782_c0_g1_i2.p1 TRINITY_DN2782_c0_g1~~TRINITY_DN2782_c0_g1_i2.p1  ORF type:complete len:901 (-),score=193.98 TRINITY_DN2782_c0_g1_i2:2153-4855(-)